MIVTLTANPSLDVTLRIDAPLKPGGVHRAQSMLREPGGKGINVSRVVHAAGHPTMAIFPSCTGDPVAAGVDDLGVPMAAASRRAASRVNTAVVTSDGHTTKFNEPGPSVDVDLVDHLRVLLARHVPGADWLVLAGSLPRFAGRCPQGEQWYAELTAIGHDLGARVALDASDGPLRAAAQRWPTHAPDLIKPNGIELGQLVGHDGEKIEIDAAAGDFTAAMRAVDAALDGGVGKVLLTLGSVGAIAATAEQAYFVTAPPIAVASTVGAGDSSLAGFLLADVDGADLPQCLRSAVAHGSAAAQLPGTGLPTPQDVELDRVAAAQLLRGEASSDSSDATSGVIQREDTL